MPTPLSRSPSARAKLFALIDDVLPQTQCTKCGYSGCAPYARAIAFDEAPINRCPPGGLDVLHKLAALTGSRLATLDPLCGPSKPIEVAVIDESQCIGCTLCIAACPVDAIVGAPRLLHAVIADHCSGCELCLPPCPMDCISMQSAKSPWTPERRARARARHDARGTRKVRIDGLIAAKHAARLSQAHEAGGEDVLRRRTTLMALRARARQRRAAAEKAQVAAQEAARASATEDD
jgi:electron transport complex protein RnfB